MNAQREEIQLRIGQMHDLLKWKLVTCGGVYAVTLEVGEKHPNEFYLLMIIPALLCLLIDSQYVQNGINIMMLGRFLREHQTDDDAYQGEQDYERYLTDMRNRNALPLVLEPAT